MSLPPACLLACVRGLLLTYSYFFHRYDDDACVDSGWEILQPGALNAECTIFLGGR